jgi:repressor LexA
MLTPTQHKALDFISNFIAQPGHAPSLPLLGRIAAGQPIEAIPDEDTLNLTEFLLGPTRFALRVQGDSMMEAGILDGDTVIIQRRETAADGDIVVALIDDEEATLKRLYHLSNKRIKLVAENSAFTPMCYAAERIRIQGVLVGQLRTYP